MAISESDKLEITTRWKECKETLASYKSTAREDYDFVASRQWSQDDLAKLNEEQRPGLTFNRAEVFVDAVVGNEINSRLEAKYIPRGMEPDNKVAEIINAASKWVRDKTNASHEENDAFRDAAICGIGVVETRMDYEEDPDGKILKERVDPLYFWWDPASKKQCLEDRRYDFTGSWVDKKLAKEMWPEAEFASSGDIWGDSDAGNSDPRTWYDGDDKKIEDRKNQVLILKYECFKRESYYKAVDPATGKVVELDSKRFGRLQKAAAAQGVELESVRLTRRVYYRAFLAGDEVLEYTKSPVQCFTRQAITGKRDRNRNEWYGLVRVMKDPQRWANKFLSQILNIIASNAKGGVLHESGAFADQRKAEEQWATPSPMIEVNEGVLSQGKIKERVPPPIPAGLERLMMFSYDSLPFVTGINLEALGLADRQQAGVLEAQRRRAAFGILAPFFENLRRFRKNDAYVTFKFIREFISDGRLVRIVGDTGDTQYVPLIKDYTTWEYDILVDESPESPDFKEKTWETMIQILPTMFKMGYPVPPEIWSFSPLPATVSQKWVEMARQGPQIPEQVKAKMQEMEQALQKMGEENAKIKEENVMMRVDHSVDLLKVQAKSAEGEAKLNLKAMEIQRSAAAEQFKAILETTVERFKAQLDAKTRLLEANITSKTKMVTEGAKSVLKSQEVRLKNDKDEQIDGVKKTLETKVESVLDRVKKVEEKAKKKGKKKIKRTKEGFEINDGESVTSIRRVPDGFEVVQG